MTPAEAWAASAEAFEMAREARAGGMPELAADLCAISDDFADQAADLERRLGIQREEVA